MKTRTILRTWTVAAAAALTAIAAAKAPAYQAGPTTPVSKHEKNCTGMVVSLDSKEHVLNVQRFLWTKKFNLGDSCTYTFVGKGPGALADLRPGQKVMLSYQNAHGVLVADRVEQEPMRYEGTVKAIDPQKRTLTLRLGAMDKRLQIADDCKVVLRNDKSGTLDNLQPGHRVTVIYETPNGTPTARQIDQTSATFTGILTAIDLSDRTVKARATFGAKKFNLADGCTIMLNGKPEGQMQDLKPGDRFTFSYDEVNGVNVATRIANAETPSQTLTAKSTR